MPVGYRQEWTEHFSLERKTRKPAKASGVIFRVGLEWLALPTPVFQEVGEQRPIHSLPQRRNGIVLGLANVRGELLICVCLRRVLGLETPPEPTDPRMDYHRLLVVNWQGNRLAFPVDEVHGPHRFQSQDLQEPPVTPALKQAAFAQSVFRWQHRTVGLLNAELIFARINRDLA
jgi:chemotaxis-related protein WspD